MSRRKAVAPSVIALFLAAAPGLSAEPAPAAPAPECGNRPPRVLNLGLPYSEGLELETLEAPLKGSFARRFLHRASRDAAPASLDPCGERPLQINAALGSPYQVLDWLDRGLVDMAVVPVLGLHLLRRDEVDLVEVEDPERAGLEPLVGRVPELTLVERAGGADTVRSGHDRHLRAFAADLWREAVLGEAPEPRPGLPPVERLVLPDHLSTAGFLMPVLEIEDELEALAGEEPSVEDRRRFWEAFYERICFRFSERLGRRAGGSCAPREGGAVLEIASRVEGAADPVAGGATVAGPPVLGARASYRDRLVIRRAVAEELFGLGTIDAVEAAPDAELLGLAALFERSGRDGLGREARLPTAFDAFLTPDAYFRTRSFAFTVAESLDLIEHDQWISGRSQLALVLPGGGVKAAYQSRVLDELYSQRHLRNAGVRTGPGEPGGPLAVRSVVGTSGGALLGYFVARLGEAGPRNLSDVLWRPGAPAAGSGRYLTSSEVFGWTDLPRYVSLLLILLVFTGVLGVFSLRRGGFLAPERLPGEWPERCPAARPRLVFLLVAVLGLTPLLVRWVNGPVSEEHVPEFEGLLYAILVVLAMFADQCLVWRETAKAPAAVARRRWPLSRLLVAAGLVLVGLPVLLRPVPGAGRWLEGEVGAGAAYLVLGALAAGLALAAVRRRVGAADRGGEVALWVASFALGTAVGLVVLQFAPRGFLEGLDRTPLLFLALFAALLVTAVLRYTGGGDPGLGTGRISRGYTALQSWYIRLSVTGRLRTVAAVLVPPLVCLIVLDLTRPEAEAFLSLGLRDLVLEPSKLHSPLGALAVCLGAVLTAAGGLGTLHERSSRYRLEGTERFRDAVALVIVGLAFTVYAALAAVVALVGWLDARGWLDDSSLFAAVAQLTLFELTPAFWIGLVAVSAAASLLAVHWARAGRLRGGRIGGFLDASLAYLCSRHPNGHLMPRRFIRLVALGVFGLAWWNFLLAPALYGNRYAVGYLKAADLRFEKAFCRSTGLSAEECEERERLRTSEAGPKPERLSDRLTARYLVPANALTTDGTRFVLAVPGREEGCPAVPASPGVTWRRFRAVETAGAPVAAAPVEESCEELDLSVPEEREVLTDYVFASGSPFPAFPPRRVFVDRERQTREALVDGGYSNNVPLEAAAKLGAEQALVIHSSHPAPPPAGGGLFTALGGPLVDNLPRLVGFLYQRSQQLDRRSGTSLLVVSLAPPYRPDWPLLTDFRSSTVERMLCTAEEDLGLATGRCRRNGEGSRAGGAGRRMGLVESWGPPRIQGSFEMSAAEISAERSRARKAPPTTPGGPPPPARVLSR